MKKLWLYLTKRHQNISILWKHMLMMACILALALLALIINNQQSLQTLTDDNIGKIQIALDRDCAALGESMHRTIAIPTGVDGTRYGGWTFASYNSENKSSAYMWVTAANHGKTAADQHSIYADSNSVQWEMLLQSSINPTVFILLPAVTIKLQMLATVIL